jgi:hypothetical protein
MHIEHTAVPCNCNVGMTFAKEVRELGFEKLTVLFFSFLRQKVAPQPVVADRHSESLTPAPRSTASNSANKFQGA